MFKNVRIITMSLLIIFIASDYMHAKPKFKGGPKTKKDSNELNTENLEKKGWKTNTNIFQSGSLNAKKGGTLTMLGGDEYPTTFRDIGKDSRSQINSLLGGLQYESLLSFDYERLEWIPNLATHWKISSDSLTYWFRLNPKAKFADGKDVTSKDVIATFKLLIDDGHEDPNVAGFWDDLFEIPIAESKYTFRVTAKKKDWRTFRYFA